MFVTTEFIGIKKGDMKYLFFLLTEEYIESNLRISDTLTPLLNEFARKLGSSGALVKPFRGSEKETLGNFISKGWKDDDEFRNLNCDLPAILVIDVDFDDFNVKSNNYFLISLRDSMDNYGNVEIFELQELLNKLIFGAKIEGLFEVAKDYFEEKRKNKLKGDVWETIELKPGAFGFKFDLKKAIEFLKDTIK